MSSYFYLQAEKKTKNASLVDQLRDYAEINKKLIYVLNKPLTDQKYKYEFKDSLIILSPKKKIAFINYSNSKNEFESYIEDVIEDIGSISDKYEYKNILGRPRVWKNDLIENHNSIDTINNLDVFFNSLELKDAERIKKIDLLISLFIGSINDVERVKEEVPITLLDKVKQKIQLFDGDQTRFIYEVPNKKRITIQGLSGTGKTELLLHKLKDLYTSQSDCRIYFTCHNKILADNLRKRIPVFFNFMKVEQQIEWESRLWCTNAWGSSGSVNSGAYRYICHFYSIPFYKYSYQMSFSRACKLAVEDIKAKYPKNKFECAFTYMLIDESQDFDENFYELCELVTQKNVYIAGDIFQSIFDENISSSIEPDYLLGKCYRTDPKTLMFAHALGMGLFEDTKLRWLEKQEWIDCGYNLKIINNKYYLSREPLRRFEDLDENFESIKIVEIEENYSDTVINLIKEIKKNNPTVKPEDIGIILLDSDSSIYKLADRIEFKIKSRIAWDVNKAYESKEKVLDSVFISNRNNVKGLEFPFVICITTSIKNSASYRNALYTMLTRSFISSYFLIPNNTKSGLTDDMKIGLKDIISKKQMIIQEPSEQEKVKIRTRFKARTRSLSHYDMMMQIFKELNIDKIHYERIMNMTLQLNLEMDKEMLTEFVQNNLKFIIG